MRHIKAVLVGMTAALLIAACASTGGGADDGDQDRLTRDQILEPEVSTLYEVVQRLRPRWLRGSGGSPTGSMGGATGSVLVYQGQTQLGGTDVLREYSPDIAYELRYLDGTTASSTLPGIGSQLVEGAIVIYTR